ncbi:MAG: hypothetical protein AAF296_00760 [Pseudomonadota bacterium]
MKFTAIATLFTSTALLGLSALAQIVEDQVPQVEEAATTTPPVVQTATPPPPVIDPLSRAAAVYGTYHGVVTDVKTGGFGSAKEIDSALTNLGGHNSEQLARGWLSYSALVASQDPDFRVAVRDIEAYYGRETLMQGLKNDVRYARSLNGGSSAVGASLSAIKADSRRLIGAAAYVKEQAYTLQGAGWAKGRIGNSSAKADGLMTSSQAGIPARRALVTALSAPEVNLVLAQAGNTGSPSVWETVTSAASTISAPAAVSTQSAQTRLKRGREPIADRIATLAAYRIMGLDADSVGNARKLMGHRNTSRCIYTAQLNLQQCVAAAHKHFEVPFCIGEHALADVGKCIGEISQ